MDIFLYYLQFLNNMASIIVLMGKVEYLKKHLIKTVVLLGYNFYLPERTINILGVYSFVFLILCKTAYMTFLQCNTFCCFRCSGNLQ